MASITNNLIQEVQIGEESPARLASTAYGECESLANTQVKVVDMTGFTLMKGVTVHVKFIHSNTATSPSLNVNSTGAFPIMQYKNSPAGTEELTSGWPEGAIISFTYDGTAWYKNFGFNDSIEYTIENTYDSTSTNPISGKGVAAALGTLDITDITNDSAGKTIDKITETDGKVGATFKNIQITESQVTNLTTDLNAKAPKANPTFTGVVTLPDINNNSADNSAATKKYVDDKTSGLTGALHYVDGGENVQFTVSAPGDNGESTVTVSGLPAGYTPVGGDVIVYNAQEFLYTGSKWRLLGDEGSYALKTNTEDVVKSATLNQTKPTLTITSKSIPNVTNAGSAPTLDSEPVSFSAVANAGSVTQAAVADGILKITIGTATTVTSVTATKINTWNAGAAPTLGTAISVGSASGWTQGEVTLNTTDATVVKP